MSELYINILMLLEKKGVSGYKMCKDIGIQPSILSDLKSGRKKGLHSETAQKMADYLGVSVNHMLNYQLHQRLDQQFKGYDMGVEAEKMRQQGYELNPDYEEDGVVWIKTDQKEKSPTPEGAELSESKKKLIEKICLMDEKTIDVLNSIADQVLLMLGK